MNVFDYWTCLVLSLALCIGLAAAGGDISRATILAILVINAASLTLGRATLTLPIAAFRPAAEYLFGLLAISLISFALCRVFTLSAAQAAVIAAAIGFAAAIFTARASRFSSGAGWPDLAVTTLIGAAALIWSWQAIIAVPDLLVTCHFNAWFDYFIHAGEIAQFADFHALRGTTIFAAGAPLPMYHYGSYMLPAALSGATGILALTAATAFWTPLGFILLGLGALVLGGVLAGVRGGVLGLVAVMLIPSASHYGLENPFFDFHWLLQISSSSAYGVAAACLAIAALVVWLREPRPAHLCWLAGLTLAVFEFRVQVFAPLAATNALVFICAWRPARLWHRPALVAAGAALVLLVMLALEQIPRAPHFFTGLHHPIRLLLTMHGMEPSRYGGAYARLTHLLPPGAGLLHDAGLLLILAAGLLLLIAAAFGAWVPLYLAALVWRRRTGQRPPEDLIPLAAIIAYLAVVALFPSNPLEKLEFAQRPFVLPYAILAIWCARFAAEAFGAAWRPQILVPLCLILLATPLRLESKAQLSNLAWGRYAVGRPVPPGLIDAAAYLRAHAAPGDAVVSPANPLDEAFIALSERPEIFPGTDFLTIQSGVSPQQYAARQSQAAEILAGTKTTAPPGAAWALTMPPGAPLAGAAFSEAGFALEHLRETRP